MPEREVKEFLSPEQILAMTAFDLSARAGDIGQKFLALVDDRGLPKPLKQESVEIATDYIQISSELWDLAWRIKKLITGVGDPYERRGDAESR